MLCAEERCSVPSFFLFDAVARAFHTAFMDFWDDCRPVEGNLKWRQMLPLRSAD